MSVILFGGYMIIDIEYFNSELLKNDLKMLWKTIEERALYEMKWNKKLDTYSKGKDSHQIDKYRKRYQGKYNCIIAYYHLRINALCDALAKLNEYDLMYIYDSLLVPIGLKELIKKYDLTSETKSYRKLDKILQIMMRR